jgi:hypothetical protein
MPFLPFVFSRMVRSLCRLLLKFRLTCCYCILCRKPPNMIDMPIDHTESEWVHHRHSQVALSVRAGGEASDLPRSAHRNRRRRNNRNRSNRRRQRSNGWIDLEPQTDELSPQVRQLLMRGRLGSQASDGNISALRDSGINFAPPLASQENADLELAYALSLSMEEYLVPADRNTTVQALSIAPATASDDSEWGNFCPTSPASPASTVSYSPTSSHWPLSPDPSTSYPPLPESMDAGPPRPTDTGTINNRIDRELFRASFEDISPSSLSVPTLSASALNGVTINGTRDGITIEDGLIPSLGPSSLPDSDHHYGTASSSQSIHAVDETALHMRLSPAPSRSLSEGAIRPTSSSLYGNFVNTGTEQWQTHTQSTSQRQMYAQLGEALVRSHASPSSTSRRLGSLPSGCDSAGDSACSICGSSFQPSEGKICCAKCMAGDAAARRNRDSTMPLSW